MRSILFLLILCQLPLNIYASDVNIGFEEGLKGWECYASNVPMSITNKSINDSSIWGNSVSIENYEESFSVIANQSITPADPICDALQLNTDCGNKFLRLGNAIRGHCEKVSYKFLFDEDKSIIKYSYALVLQEPSHNKTQRPSFIASVSILRDGELIDIGSCASSHYYGDSNVFADLEACSSNSSCLSKKWAYNLIDLKQFDAVDGDSIVLSFATFDCTLGAHFGYAYVDAEFVNTSFSINGSNEFDKICLNEEVTFSYPGAGIFKGEEYKWSIIDKQTGDIITTQESQDSMVYSFEKAGNYKILLEINIKNDGNTNMDACVLNRTVSQDLHVDNCAETGCNDCPSRFAPEPGEKYVVGGWVSVPSQLDRSSFEDVYIEIRYSDGTSVQCMPEGNIIDGWQRISQTIEIPKGAKSMTIALKNTSDASAYFDDIRFHPVNASMKSYVYDPETLRLTAELDEQNYATFYDYDEEGALVRVRKETERGVMTIREARQSKPKRD